MPIIKPRAKLDMSTGEIKTAGVSDFSPSELIQGMRQSYEEWTAAEFGDIKNPVAAGRAREDYMKLSAAAETSGLMGTLREGLSRYGSYMSPETVASIKGLMPEQVDMVMRARGVNPRSYDDSTKLQFYTSKGFSDQFSAAAVNYFNNDVTDPHQKASSSMANNAFRLAGGDKDKAESLWKQASAMRDFLADRASAGKLGDDYDKARIGAVQGMAPLLTRAANAGLTEESFQEAYSALSAVMAPPAPQRLQDPEAPEVREGRSEVTNSRVRDTMTILMDHVVKAGDARVLDTLSEMTQNPTFLEQLSTGDAAKTPTAFANALVKTHGVANATENQLMGVVSDEDRARLTKANMVKAGATSGLIATSSQQVRDANKVLAEYNELASSLNDAMTRGVSLGDMGIAQALDVTLALPGGEQAVYESVKKYPPESQSEIIKQLDVLKNNKLTNNQQSVYNTVNGRANTIDPKQWERDAAGVSGPDAEARKDVLNKAAGALKTLGASEGFVDSNASMGDVTLKNSPGFTHIAQAELAVSEYEGLWTSFRGKGPSDVKRAINVGTINRGSITGKPVAALAHSRSINIAGTEVPVSDLFTYEEVKGKEYHGRLWFTEGDLKVAMDRALRQNRYHLAKGGAPVKNTANKAVLSEEYLAENAPKSSESAIIEVAVPGVLAGTAPYVKKLDMSTVAGREEASLISRYSASQAGNLGSTPEGYEAYKLQYQELKTKQGAAKEATDTLGGLGYAPQNAFSRRFDTTSGSSVAALTSALNAAIGYGGGENMSKLSSGWRASQRASDLKIHIAQMNLTSKQQDRVLKLAIEQSRAGRSLMQSKVAFAAELMTGEDALSAEQAERAFNMLTGGAQGGL